MEETLVISQKFTKWSGLGVACTLDGAEDGLRFVAALFIFTLRD
jgi:hypothetical protein